ncbi:MAG: YitT family protein [Firmicutes bacterium]|nr:YitT family protein [Bacillota bacterium]
MTNDKTTFDSALKALSFYGALILLSAIGALGVYVFILPNNFTIGGFNGIAIIVYNIVAKYNQTLASGIFNPGIFSFILNVPLFIVAAIKINKQFALNTLLSVSVYAFLVWLFEFVSFPQFAVPNPDSAGMILAVVMAGLLIGIRLGFMLLMNLSAGGTDTIARLVYNHNPTINAQWLVLIFDAIVVISSGILGISALESGHDASQAFVIIMSPVLFSFIHMYICSKTADVIFNGIESSVVFNIITDKPTEISDYVVKTLGRSTTILTGEGHFTRTSHKLVLVVVSRKQRVNFRRLIQNLDPDCFMYVTTTKEVSGKGFGGRKL